MTLIVDISTNDIRRMYADTVELSGKDSEAAIALNEELEHRKGMIQSRGYHAEH